MAVYLGENKVDLVLKANNGNNVEWSDILNKPDSYNPSTHVHSQYQLSGNYLTATTFIPSKTSELINDSNFISSHQSLSNYYTKNETSSAVQIKNALENIDLSEYYKKTETSSTNQLNSEFKKYQISGNYLSSNTFIPTKTSELINDSNFISSHQSLSNYYDKDSIDALISDLRNSINNLENMISSVQIVLANSIES